MVEFKLIGLILLKINCTCWILYKKKITILKNIYIYSSLYFLNELTLLVSLMFKYEFLSPNVRAKI